MPRRGENIRKRKDGRWEARYVKGVDENGVRKYGSVYGNSYLEVKAKKMSIFQETTREKGTRNPSCLLRDVLRAWQDANRVRLKEASVSRYQNIIDAHIDPDLGFKSMDQIDAAMINKFLAEKLRNGRLDGTGGLSPAYVRSIMLIISAAISYATSERICQPLRLSINKPTIRYQELAILSEDEQAMLENRVLSDMDGCKLGVYISLYTGLRIGEVCALAWEDVDLEEKIIHVRHTVSRIWYVEKGKKISKLVLDSPKTPSSFRSIPICSKLYDVLVKYPHRNSSCYVVSENQSFVSPRTYEYRYKKLLMMSGIRNINYHALRHTFATRCIEAAVDVKSLSEILGHANVSITLNTYVHSSIELKRKQLEKLAYKV